MTVVGSPPVNLAEVVAALDSWQPPGAPVQLHAGDVGWNVRFGLDETLAALRVWRRDDRIAAVAMVDSPGVVRFAFAPDAVDDDDLATAVAVDLGSPVAGLLPPAGEAAVELRSGGRLAAVLRGRGWADGETWTPLIRELAAPVEVPDSVRVEVVGTPEQVADRVAVQRAAFARSTLTPARWQAMSDQPGYASARCLVAYDAAGHAVAAATVWSAGPGRQGLLEPVGGHPDFRGQGHGRAIVLAAAATLRDLGASTAVVCTPSANTVGVRTYASAGFTALDPVPDLDRGPAH